MSATNALASSIRRAAFRHRPPPKARASCGIATTQLGFCTTLQLGRTIVPIEGRGGLQVKARSLAALVAISCGSVLLLPAATAGATFPGTNGKLAFYDFLGSPPQILSNRPRRHRCETADRRGETGHVRPCLVVGRSAHRVRLQRSVGAVTGTDRGDGCRWTEPPHRRRYQEPVRGGPYVVAGWHPDRFLPDQHPKEPSVDLGGRRGSHRPNAPIEDRSQRL